MTTTLPPRRKRVGLVLSGGIGRAAAHVGVLSVLEREGIPIDFVAGASAGALIGSAYCAGIGISKLRELALKMRWRDIASPIWPRRGFVSFAKMERWLIGLAGDVTFADLKLPFALVAADMKTGQPVVLREGRVAPAVRASASVPGFVEPAEIDGRILCDGSVSYNLPVAPVREMGADYVIGVQLFTSSFGWGWGPLGFGITAIEIMLHQSNAGLSNPDCLITPDLAGVSYLDLSKGAELMALGEQAAEARLPVIRAALAAVESG